MKLKVKYVDSRTNNAGSVYYYFRKRGRPLQPLPGVPGSKEFSDRYHELLAIEAPQVLRRLRGGAFEDKGTLGWVISEYKKPDNRAWTKLSESSQVVYNRHFDWLRQNYGDVLLAAFDQDMVRAIRNERKDSPSAANMTVDKLGQLWNWAKEHCELTGRLKLPAINPTLGVASLETDAKPAPAWPLELCEAIEKHPNRKMVTFYFLARYTGQRRGDVCDMKWADFNEKTRKIFVMQEKTGTRVWVPAHKRLRDYLASVPRAGEHVLTSQYGRKFAATGVTNRIIEMTRDDLKFVDADGDVYSPHGLRHLCGAALAEAGCTVQEIMSILGHVTEKQANHYVRQANRNRMGESAIRRWEEHDEAALAPLGEEKITTLSERRRARG
jgi:integrase